MNKENQQASNALLIAVIDDDQSVRSALSNLLHSAGYQTCSFDSAEAFLAGDCMHVASCAIMDVTLGNMNGFELQEQLRARQLALPVIFVSGQGTRLAQERAAQLGAIAFLKKPINTDTLLMHIKRITTAS